MDCVVTCPKDLWDEWVAEGDLPGEPWSGLESHFYLRGPAPTIRPGERVYVVAHGALRGYAPLVRLERGVSWDGDDPRGWALVRHGGAVACTLRESVRGFRGWKYRWWPREDETVFPEWQYPEGLPLITADQHPGAPIVVRG